MNFDHDLGSISSVLVIDTTVAPPTPGGEVNSLRIDGTGALLLPSGTTAEQPSVPEARMIRFNTTTGAVEFHNGSVWSSAAAISNVAGNGVVVQTAAGQFTTRTISGTSGNITVTDGDGVNGNPTINLPNVGTPVTGSLVKLTTDAQGRITATVAVGSSDITSLVDSIYVNTSGDTMTGFLTLHAEPINAMHAATKGYVDSVSAGLDPKTSVYVATTGNIGATYNATGGTGGTGLFSGAPTVVDGKTVTTSGQRILVRAESDNKRNGIYVVVSSGVWERASDHDGSPAAEVSGGNFTFVESGDTLFGTGWVLTGTGNLTLNTDPIIWTQFSATGAFTWGQGLSNTGNVVNIDLSAAELTAISSTVQTADRLAIYDNSAASTGGVTVGTLLTDVNLNTTSNATFASVTAASVKLDDTDSSNFLTVQSTSTLTADRILTLNVDNASRTLRLGADVTIIGDAFVLNTTSAAGGSVLIYSGTQWIDGKVDLADSDAITGTLGVTFGGTGVSAVAQGDLLYASAANTLSVLAKDTNATRYLSNGGASNNPIWAQIDLATGVTGTLPINRGGTGQTTQTTAFDALSPTTTKGDLIVHNGTNNVRLTVGGTNNHAILVDSSTATGLKYAAVQLPLQLYSENPSSPAAPSAGGTNAVAIGSGSIASAIGSYAVGDGTDAKIWGQKAVANGKFATAGDAQHGVYVLRNITTNNTVTELFLDGTNASQRLVLPNNSLFTFQVLVAGRRTDATGGGAGYKFEGVIRKDASAVSTTFVGTPAKSILGETDAPWDSTITVDTTNGSLRVRVQGQNGKTIRWVATVLTTEVTN